MSQEAATRALDIINNLGGNASEFRTKWLTIHAFASVFENQNQRRSLISAIESSISEEEANEILCELTDEIVYLTDHPVGNLELDSAHRRFYQNARQDIAQASLAERYSPNRLGHLVCVVYQVRCNTEHGRKELGTERSQRLFAISNRIMGLVIPVLVRVTDAA